MVQIGKSMLEIKQAKGKEMLMHGLVQIEIYGVFPHQIMDMREHFVDILFCFELF